MGAFPPAAAPLCSKDPGKENPLPPQEPWVQIDGELEEGLTALRVMGVV